jgi:hypothetical protein
MDKQLPASEKKTPRVTDMRDRQTPNPTKRDPDPLSIVIANEAARPARRIFKKSLMPAIGGWDAFLQNSVQLFVLSSVY